MRVERAHRVGLLLLPGASIFELSFPLEVFGEDRRDLHDPWYELHLLAPGRASTRLGNGLVASQTEDLAAASEMDTLIVPAPGGAPPEAGMPRSLLAALGDAHA
ncbi:MAG: AraC family transcriptional regulator, partial [Candidatus Dormibacteraceae bacterium]